MKSSQKSIYYYLFLFSFIFIINGCLDKTKDFEPMVVDFETTDLLLHKLENNGDFINSPQNPPLVDAIEIYEDPENFILIDIRTPYEFSLGRIPNSINLKSSDLLDYFSNNIEDKGVVLISSTGQSAAFFCSIIRLNGFNNVYSLNFGITSWNDNFTYYWQNAIKDQNESFYNGIEVQLNTYSLPESSFSEPNEIMKELKIRSQRLLEMGFNDKESKQFENELTITFDKIFSNYYKMEPNPRKKMVKEWTLDTAIAFIVGYGENDLFYQEGGTTVPKYTRQTVFYNITEKVRSSEMLFNLPTNKPIFIYSYNGQRSAYLTAYLRLLGYPAKSISFGANNMIYSIIKKDAYTKTFTRDKIMNYLFEHD